MDISLSSSPQEWIFFAKGNANAVYRYTGSSSQLIGKVLRVRLSKPSGEYIPTIELFEFVKEKCKRHFSRIILEPELVKLKEAFLSGLETQGFELMSTERFGFLLEDMLDGTCESYKLSKHCKLHLQLKSEGGIQAIKSIMIEMKPKWLYDNDSVYCRNCSLNIYRGLERHFCPLDFLHQDSYQRGVDDLLSRVPKDVPLIVDGKVSVKLRELFRHFLTVPDNVFQILKNLQGTKNDKDKICNVKSEDQVSDELLFAMTLRDVGVFIQFVRLDSGEFDFAAGRECDVVTLQGQDRYIIKSTIYDLDRKSPSKLEHWKGTDSALKSLSNTVKENWRPCRKS